MSLLSLPPEVLLTILRSVGPHEFQKDTRRLSVCRKWYSFARIVLFEEIRLTVGSLIHTNTRQSLAAQNYPAANCRGLAISLDNCGETPRQASSWTVTSRPLNQSLQQLAQCLHKSDRLRSLKLGTPRPEVREPAKPYTSGRHPKQWILQESSITNFLDFSLAVTLKTLHLDLANCFSTNAIKRAHYCVWIAELLPTLSHVRIRLPRICPDCFAGHRLPSQQAEPRLPTTQLKTLAVCVSVCDEWCGDVWKDQPLFGIYAFPCRRPTDSQVGPPEPNVISEPSRTQLLDSIKSLASRSPNMKIARFLHHLKRDSTRRLIAFDCLTGEEHMMTHDNDWAAGNESDEGDSEFPESPRQSDIDSLSSDEDEQ
jgi:F-box-like